MMRAGREGPSSPGFFQKGRADFLGVETGEPRLARRACALSRSEFQAAMRGWPAISWSRSTLVSSAKPERPWEYRET